ncbi:MAG TPA: matrixin family metalloprotease, partial [Candidatus Acidoferrales bacterium]|nr:matrixin family metalloprotease [Candidatus Acidoferrales bacterium]
WDTNVLNAADEWNSAGAAFQYTVVQDDNGSPNFTCPGSGQCGGAPGDNPIFFSSTACSGGFGDIVAVTVTCWDDTGAIVDAPVLFNSTVPWNAYDGALQPPLNDIHRVLLHEFGHVFGLAHPDQATPPQIVVAIMNSHESDTYQLQPDDISGIQTIYRNNAAPTTGCQIDAPNGARATWLLVVPAVIALRRRARAC